MYHFTRPIITDLNMIEIRGGRYVTLALAFYSVVELIEIYRHPLQELSVRTFVPNDTLLVGGVGAAPTDRGEPHGSPARFAADPGRLSGPSMLIMTGPNYSGKSIYLKQVKSSIRRLIILEVLTDNSCH